MFVVTDSFDCIPVCAFIVICGITIAVGIWFGGQSAHNKGTSTTTVTATTTASAIASETFHCLINVRGSFLTILFRSSRSGEIRC